MKIFTIKTLFTLGIIAIFFVPDIIAQGASKGAPYGPGGAKGGAPYGGESVPIDGGAALLLVAGAAYGIKKIKERRANSKNYTL